MNLSDILKLLSYSFIIRSIIAGALISVCASLLGVILVLKKYSLIGHGLSDVGFASISLALALGVSPLYISMPIVIITSFVIMYISQSKKINGDISIGIFSTGALAIGITINSLSKGANMDVYSYMFGSILTIGPDEVIISLILAFIVISIFVISYNRLFSITIDENFAKSMGINVSFYQFLISFLTAITVVIGMRLMGTLLISSLIIFPAVIAKKFVRSFKSLIILSAIISVISFFVGIISSFIFNLPIGAGIVLIDIIIMLISSMSFYVSSKIN